MDMLAVGIIRTSHGVHGYVKVLSLSGETEHLFTLKKVHVYRDNRGKEYPVEDMKPYKGGVLLKLEGIDTPESAKTLSGSEVWVHRDEAAPLSDEEYYVADLCGCAVLCGGERVGEIISVASNEPNDLLEVKTDHGTRIVPFSARFVGSVDLEAETVELLVPELLE